MADVADHAQLPGAPIPTNEHSARRIEYDPLDTLDILVQARAQRPFLKCEDVPEILDLDGRQPIASPKQPPVPDNAGQSAAHLLHCILVEPDSRNVL